MLAAACGPTPTVTYEPITLTLAVSAECERLASDLMDQYRADNPHISFTVIQGDSAGALEAVLAGQAALAVVNHISTTEMIWLSAVAIDNMAIIVHPTSSIKNLAALEVRDVFHGRDSSWREAGGGAGEITVITRERGAEIRTDFEGQVLEGRNVTLNALVAPSSEAVIELVSTITTAVGYVSMGERPAGVRMIAVEDVLPTPLTAANRSYPLHRPFYLVALEEPAPGPEGYLREFVAWMLGPDGQLVVGQRYGRVK
jgi:phosphate transport system substrate-binding protein